MKYGGKCVVHLDLTAASGQAYCKECLNRMEQAAFKRSKKESKKWEC
jgi:hypothetical protein